MNFEYVPLTFIQDKTEIKKLIRNTLILTYLFEKFNSPVPLENLIEGTQYGYNASSLSTGRNKFLRISDIQENKVNWESVPYCNCDNEKTYLLLEDDILIARTGGTTGKSFKIQSPPKNSIYAGYLIRLRANQITNPEYIYLFLNSYVYWSQIVNLNDRNFRPKANAENLKSLIIPDCSKKIQDDVVRISQGEILTGYDKLYKKINKAISYYEKTQNINSLLQQQLIHVDNLNKSILREGISGKLVRQKKEDGYAKELLEKIKIEKSRTVKNEKQLLSISEKEIPFGIPENWVWCRLGEICNYGSSPKAEPKDLHNNTWVLDLEDIEKETSKLISKKRFFERNSLSTKSIFKKGQILYSKLRPYLDKVIVADENGVCTTEILPLELYCRMNPYFLRYVMKSDYFLSYVNSVTKGMKMPRLGTNEGRSILIPLPPVEEQNRIVSALDHYSELCGKLKTNIYQSKIENDKLLSCVLREVVWQ